MADPAPSRLGRGLGSMVNEVSGIRAGSAPTGSGFMRIPVQDIREPVPGRTPDHTLRDSIKSFGVLQPLLVARAETGYTLLAGARRLKAAKECGLADVPALVIPPDRAGPMDVFLEENLTRHELTEMERVRLRNQWMRETGRDEDQARRRIPEATPAVTETLMANGSDRPDPRWKYAAIGSGLLALALLVILVWPTGPSEPIVSDQMDLAVDTALAEAEVQTISYDNAWMDPFRFPGNARIIEADTLNLLHARPFFVNRSDLSPSARVFLCQLAAVILSSDRALDVDITGYGEDAASPADRYPLALERALAAARFLQAEGIPQENIRIDGSSTLPDTLGNEKSVTIAIRPK